ncbi:MULTISPECIES: TIR domain-containing protein [unclassified Amycolatopsis]|uniref:TIR domain-containing protein n=1 Tax=unclassified Amycolatopsis TaxID=2618356 RepID=UPI0028763F1C|nr:MULTISPECIES: TIR domain-containing protein [unclassified Amycolatopsis]MDS0133243.1 toll/interleukin-1 receptor domain-containing protein [Amycolatopsis sp. 505]MDS0146473.1 toll/interleukin-1 receptor domain-containing protein [Amycolatopsis sp. CM201R]
MPGYKYDLFISYPRRGTASKWLLTNFYPWLVDFLVDEVGYEPKIFLDKGMHRGVHWPSQLENALRHSKIMVAVLSAPYFTSKWCMAEWKSMQAREEVLGLASPQCPQGLIYPIRYSDSNAFEEEGLRRSWWDFKGLDNPGPGYQDTRDWHSFQQKVRQCAQDLADLLKQVPAWQSDWPVIAQPDPVLPPPPLLPRFGS